MVLCFPNLPERRCECICEAAGWALTRMQAAKATMRTIFDPSTFPTGFTIDDRLVAVTFARSGSLSIAYAKTTWSFTDEDVSGGRQELIYCDDAAYGAIYDSAAFTRAQKVIQEESAKASDVDAFFSELEKEHPPEKVTAPPAFTLTGKVPLYALPCTLPSNREVAIVFSDCCALAMIRVLLQKVSRGDLRVGCGSDRTASSQAKRSPSSLFQKRSRSLQILDICLPP